MKSSPRVVIDTNVFISSLFRNDTPPFQAIQKAFKQGTVLISEKINLELEDVFFRKKFEKYSPIEVRSEYLSKIIRQSILIEVTSEFPDGCSDKKDNMFLELAVDGKADCIISGNEIHLNILKEFRGIPILTPRQFVDLELDS